MKESNNRVAIIGIIVSDISASSDVNDVLHKYNEYIIGRMGIPYRERGLSIISIAIDGPADKINELTGKLGQIEGVSSQATFSKLKKPRRDS